MAGVHEDFGEKIGGAKKDLWKDRGLYADDLEAMNEREAEKFVKKDNVWKKPDYAAMLEEGIPLGVVYFIKKARDGLNASPQYYRTDDTPEKRTARQKEYIKTVRELQAVLSDVRTVEDAVRAYDRFFVDNGYLEKVQGWGTLPLSVSELREAADGQLSMFGVGRPSVMDQLAANRPADKKSPAQTVSRKNHEPEI